MIQPIQIIFIVFALFALSRAWLQFKEGRIKKIELAFWALLWASAITVIALPDSAGQVAKLLGIGRAADLLVYVAILVLFYLNFRQYVALDSIEQKISKVVKEVAIQRAKKK